MVADLQKEMKKSNLWKKYMGQELRSRYFNPEYIKEMQKEGVGARAYNARG